MSFQEDFFKPAIAMFLISLPISAIYIALMPPDPPIWPLMVLGVLGTPFFVVAMNIEADAREKREDNLAIAKHEAEVKLRIAAEQRLPT